MSAKRWIIGIVLLLPKKIGTTSWSRNGFCTERRKISKYGLIKRENHKEFLKVTQEFELLNPTRETNHLSFHNLRALNTSSHIFMRIPYILIFPTPSHLIEKIQIRLW